MRKEDFCGTEASDLAKEAEISNGAFSTALRSFLENHLFVYTLFLFPFHSFSLSFFLFLSFSLSLSLPLTLSFSFVSYRIVSRCMWLFRISQTLDSRVYISLRYVRLN